jgi:hypothetical protein
MVIAIAKDAMRIETITTTAANHGGRFANITGAGGNAGALSSCPVRLPRHAGIVLAIHVFGSTRETWIPATSGA